MTKDGYAFALSKVDFDDFKPWCQKRSLKKTKTNFHESGKYEGEPGKEDEEPGFREVGVVLNVTPTIEKYNSINLDLKPKVTEFDGFIEYGGPSGTIGTGTSTATVLTPSGILMPIFSVRKVETQVQYLMERP